MNTRFTNYGPVLRSKTLRQRLKMKKYQSRKYYGAVLRRQPIAPRHPFGPYLKAWWGVPLAILCSPLWFLRLSPDFIEQVYARKLYRAIASFYGLLTSILPISLFEVLTVAGVLAFLFFLCTGLYHWRHWKDAHRLFATLRWTLNLAGLTLSLFILLCAPNYSRLPFSESSELQLRDTSTEALYALCESLAQEANTLRNSLPENQEGVFTLDRSTLTLLGDAQDIFNTVGDPYTDILPSMPIRPKPVLLSYGMSLAQITGLFSPVTMEANINVLAPEHTLAATACHELAHTRGFMREDEANFIAYLACTRSDDPVFRYSGVMLGIIHAGNRLAATDPELYHQFEAALSDSVQRDLAENNRYWENFGGPIATMSNAVNDAYLKVNGQPDGVQSYGRMVDLLLASFQEQQSPQENTRENIGADATGA